MHAVEKQFLCGYTWIEGDVGRIPLMKNIFVDLLPRVSYLIDDQSKCWNMEKLQELFYEEDITRILAMKTVSIKRIYGCGFITRMVFIQLNLNTCL